MKTIEWSPDEGADAGKCFVITRMDAFTADRWAMRLIRGLSRAGLEVPDSALKGGIAGLAGVGMALFGHLDDRSCDEALSALIGCVKIRRGPNPHAVMPQSLLSADIDDPQTLTALRTEAFRLHVDFLKAASSQISPLVAALMERGDESGPSPDA